MSIYTDPGSWRRRTAGGIPYCLVEGYPRISSDYGASTAEEVYILRATDVDDFLLESFPMTVLNGTVWYIPPNRQMPGVSALRTKHVNFEPFEPGKPCDPFGADPLAPDGTYTEFMKATISYETQTRPEQDENDITSSLEVSGSAGAEYTMMKPDPNCKWEDNTRVTDIDVPASRMIPELEWSIRWPTMDPATINTLIARCRPYLGTVNSAAMPVLMNAPAETILFLGMDFQEKYVWGSSNSGESRPSAQLSMKMVEKRAVKKDGSVVGHNHFFRPGNVMDFQKLVRSDGSTMYPAFNLNNMFV